MPSYVSARVSHGKDLPSGYCRRITESFQVDFQSPWWMGALHYMAATGLEGDLCHRIKDELSSTDMELGSIGRFVSWC